VLNQRHLHLPPDRVTLPLMWCAFCGRRIVGDDLILDHGVVPYHPAGRAVRGEIIVEERDDQ
jgi:hypothetical protein